MTKTYRAFTQDGNIIIKYDNEKNLRDVATITTKKGNELNVIFPEKKIQVWKIYKLYQDLYLENIEKEMVLAT